MERADLWDRYNLYVTYAFGSAHVKVRRINRSRTFAFLFDWRSRIERRVDPNINLSILTDSYVDLYMRRTKWLGSAHVKFDVWTGPKLVTASCFSSALSTIKIFSWRAPNLCPISYPTKPVLDLPELPVSVYFCSFHADIHFQSFVLAQSRASMAQFTKPG